MNNEFKIKMLRRSKIKHRLKKKNRYLIKNGMKELSLISREQSYIKLNGQKRRRGAEH